MARKLRIQYPGAIYHVMNRGDHQERIFCDDQDRHQFLATLEEGCQKTAWQVHSFCLMSNHFHLVVVMPAPNLVEGMKWFLSVYTRRFDLRHRIFGHLFSGRYKALVVEGSGNGSLLRGVHQGQPPALWKRESAPAGRHAPGRHGEAQAGH